MIVVDSSAAVEAFTGNVRARTLLIDHHVVAPHLIDAEFMHVIRKHLFRNDISARKANAVIAAWVAFEIDRAPTFALNSIIWHWRDNLTPYDATYVAAAKQLDVPLLTCDQRMAKAAERYCQVIQL